VSARWKLLGYRYIALDLETLEETWLETWLETQSAMMVVAGHQPAMEKP